MLKATEAELVRTDEQLDITTQMLRKAEAEIREQDREQTAVNGKYYLTRSPEDIQILVAGGPGKHSAIIPTFGFTEACSVRIRNV